MFQRGGSCRETTIDVYNAWLGAGVVAALMRKGDLAARELEAAAGVAEVSSSEREFAKEVLGSLVQPMDGSAAAYQRLRLRLQVKRHGK